MTSQSPNPKTATVKGQTILVTGANRGIGAGFVGELLARGARRVYATARQLDSLQEIVALDTAREVPLALALNDPEKRAAVAAAAADVTWLINNAGVPGSSVETERRVLAASNLDDARFVMETNCWAPTELTRMFVPIIRSNGGGAIVNVLSVGAWYCVPAHTTYSMAKAAAMMMTAGFRAELHREPILVSGVFTAGVATRMSAGNGMSPEEHAQQVLDALARGETDILAGTGAEQLWEQVRNDRKALELDRIEKFYQAMGQ